MRPVRAVCLLMLASGPAPAEGPSTQVLMNAVALVQPGEGLSKKTCAGIQIEPSSGPFLLTASHCRYAPVRGFDSSGQTVCAQPREVAEKAFHLRWREKDVIAWQLTAPALGRGLPLAQFEPPNNLWGVVWRAQSSAAEGTDVCLKLDSGDIATFELRRKESVVCEKLRKESPIPIPHALCVTHDVGAIKSGDSGSGVVSLEKGEWRVAGVIIATETLAGYSLYEPVLRSIDYDASKVAIPERLSACKTGCSPNGPVFGDHIRLVDLLKPIGKTR